MIFYHVSIDLEKDGFFYPRRPNLTMENELFDMNRICVAPTIADCFTAIPNGGSRLDTLSIDQAGLFKVFRIDTEKLGIPESAIISSKELFEKAWVPDAEWSEEYWIMESFTVPEEDSFIIHVVDWQEESHDIIPHNIYQVADESYEGDYFAAYRDYVEDMIPCMTAIKNIRYTEGAYKEGEDFYLFVEDTDILENVVVLAKSLYGVEMAHDGMDLMSVVSGELTIEQLAICAFGDVEELQAPSELPEWEKSLNALLAKSVS